VKIKRLFITDEDSASARKSLCWEDEHGSWLIGGTNSPSSFAQGVMGSPGAADQHTEGPHPELATVAVFSDWFGKGEDGPSSELQTIIDPVIVEAWRRWNAGMYFALPAGDVAELPTPGRWTINDDGSGLQRLGDA